MFINNKILIRLFNAGITTIFLTPFLFQLFQIDFTEFVIGDLLNYSYPYIIGLIFFLPWLLFTIIGLFLFSKFIHKFLYKKFFLIILNIIIIFSIFYFISGETLIYNIDVLFSYLMISTVTLLFFYRE